MSRVANTRAGAASAPSASSSSRPKCGVAHSAPAASTRCVKRAERTASRTIDRAWRAGGDAPPQAGEARRRARIGAERRCDRRQCFAGEHIPVARCPQQSGEPSDLGDERVAPGRRRNEAEARSQPARPDAHLVHPFGIGVGEESRGIPRDLLEAALHDDPQCVFRRRITGQRRRAGVHWRPHLAVRAARERVAALGLVRAADRQRHVLCEPLREAEQRERMAGDDLDLDFGDRRRPAASANRAGIDREGRRGSIRECERNGVAHEIRRELRCEQSLAHGLQQHAMPRRRAKCATSKDARPRRHSYSLRACRPALLPGAAGP